ncbi:TonB family protein [Marinilabiliaceae bacterium ANBcel2]|nr:TonB family protein [Marinilabiliaceae bacterium ANBcel2]
MNLRVYYLKKSNQSTCFMVVVTILLLICSTSFAQVNDSIYTNVDKEARFNGKPTNVQRYIEQNLIYPDNAWRNGIEGVVSLSFVVTDEGVPMNVLIEESVSPEIDMEALRIVDSMTDWKPAKLDGMNVNSRVQLDIEFKLSSSERELVETLKSHQLTDNPPLYILDNKIVNTLVHLPSYNVKSIRVLKGEPAIERFGNKGKNGVVIIETKRGTPPIR